MGSPLLYLGNMLAISGAEFVTRTGTGIGVLNGILVFVKTVAPFNGVGFPVGPSTSTDHPSADSQCQK